MIGPQRILPTGCTRYVNDVTTPKFPPPPRIAQNRSGSSVALAFRIRPSAVTISASSRLSHASPCFRIRIPKPPPSVSPAIPVSETIPPVVARPCAWVARSRSRQVAPPSAVAIRRPGSTCTPFIEDRSTTRPPSQIAVPETPCPPPRTDSGTPWSRAKVTARTTSCVPRQRTIIKGFRSIISFQIRRASSYCSAPWRMSSPCKLDANFSTTFSATIIDSLHVHSPEPSRCLDSGRPRLRVSPRYGWFTEVPCEGPKSKRGFGSTIPSYPDGSPPGMVARTRRARVTGIGGIIFKAKDPKALVGWYRRHWGSPSRTRWPSSPGAAGRRARQKDTGSGPFSLRKHFAPGQKRGRSCDTGVQMSVIDADVKGRTRVEPSGPSSEEGLATTETGHSRRTVTLILAGLLAGLLLGFMDVTIVSTAGPTIISELGGLSLYAWVFSAFLIVQTVTIPIFGKLSDLYGRKRLFLLGVVVFMAGSVLSGASQSIVELVLFRAVQGLGFGAFVPTTIAIAGDMFPPERRGRVQGLLFSVNGIAFALAPAVGSFLTETISWRWIFYINLPVGVVSLVLILSTLKESRA